MTDRAPSVLTVLFDLAGVVVEINDMAEMLRAAGVNDTDRFAHTWLRCPAVRAFESGRSDEAAFAHGVIESQSLNMAPEAFLAAFRAWPKGVYPDVLDLIAEVRTRVPVGCLSNTNPIHWPSFSGQLDGGRIFDHPILSFEIGLMKPDREIFEYAVERVGTPPETILFLDDHPANVEGARGAGLRAECVVGPVQARAALIRHGVLKA